MVLDSDILIYFLKGKTEIVEELLKITQKDLYITRINYTELLYGVYNSSRVEENMEKVLPFLKQFKILEFNEKSSYIFATTKAELKKQGNMIDDMDLMIASIVIANDEVLYTNNLKHFQRLKELKLKNR